MRILSVSPYYEPEGGGLERYAHAILSRLAARGHAVEALAFTRGEASTSEMDGVRVERLRPRTFVGNSPVDPSFTRRVAAAMRRFSPEVVVAHTPVPFPAEMAYRAARRAGVPFVATYHAGRLRGSSPGLGLLAALDRWTLERRMLAGARRLVAVAPYVREHALARERDRVTIVPPGVDTDVFYPDGRKEPATILFVGPLSRAYRWKGVDVLWEAFRRVRERRKDVRLEIIGGGDRYDEFQRKHQPGARLLGRVSQSDLAQAYRRASVVVLPSTTDAESFGMVLAEANASGRPVVASRIGGIPDFVEDGGNGLLARPGDAEDLASKLLRVLDDPRAAERMGQRGRERVLRDHRWEDLALRTETVLEDAAN